MYNSSAADLTNERTPTSFPSGRANLPNKHYKIWERCALFLSYCFTDNANATFAIADAEHMNYCRIIMIQLNHEYIHCYQPTT